MGEIDTKPIEPVQVALSLFGEKGDHKKHRSTSSDVRFEANASYFCHPFLGCSQDGLRLMVICSDVEIHV